MEKRVQTVVSIVSELANNDSCKDDDDQVHLACEADPLTCSEDGMGVHRSCADAMTLIEQNEPDITCASTFVTGPMIATVCCASCAKRHQVNLIQILSEGWTPPEEAACKDDDAAIRHACEVDIDGCGKGKQLGSLYSCAAVMQLLQTSADISCETEMITGQTIRDACCTSCSDPALASPAAPLEASCKDDDSAIRYACEVGSDKCGEGTILGPLYTCAAVMQKMVTMPGLACVSELVTGQRVGDACCASCAKQG